MTVCVHPLDLFGTKTKGRVAGVERFKFKARVLNSHTLVVETPSPDFSDAGNDDDMIRTALQKRRDGEAVMNAIDNGFNVHKEKFEDTGKMEWHVKFPDSVHLNATVLATHQDQPDGDLKMEPLMVATDAERMMTSNHFQEQQDFGKGPITVNVRENFYHAAPRVFWRIADKSKTVETTGRATETVQTDDDFAASFMNG